MVELYWPVSVATVVSLPGVTSPASCILIVVFTPSYIIWQSVQYAPLEFWVWLSMSVWFPTPVETFITSEKAVVVFL